MVGRHFISYGLLLCGILLAFTGCMGFVRQLPPPSFAQSKASQPGVAANILYWRRDEVVRVSNMEGFAQESVVRVTQRIQFLRAEGFVHATKVIRNGVLEKLYVRTQCPDGSKYELHKSGVQQVARGVLRFPGNYILLWNYKFTAPGVGIGCVVDFHYVVTYGRMSPSLQLPIVTELPIQEAHFTLKDSTSSKSYSPIFEGLSGLWWRLSATGALPKHSANLTFHRLGVKQQLQALQQYVSYKEDNGTLSLHLRDIPPQKVSGPRIKIAAPALGAPYRRVARVTFSLLGVTSFDAAKTWSLVDAWLYRRFFLVNESSAKVGGLPAIARRLTQGVSGRSQRIRLLHNHIQLRFKVSMTEGFRKSPVWQGYQARFGNRYVVAMALVVMLRAVGIRAYPALIVPGPRRTPRRSPAPTLYKDILVYVAPAKERPWRGWQMENNDLGATRKFPMASKGGTFLVPTDAVLDVGALPAGWGGRWCFVSDGQGGRLVQAPKPRWQDNRRMTRLVLQIGPKGHVKAQLTEQLVGTLAAPYQRLTANKRQLLRQERARQVCGASAQLTTSRESRQASSPKITLQMTMKGRFCGISFGRGRLMLPPLPSWLIRPLSLPRLHGMTRAAPLSLGPPQEYAWELLYRLPMRGKYAKKRSWKGSCPGMSASLEVLPTAGGTAILVRGRWRIHKRMVKASAYPKVRQFLEQLRERARRPIQLYRQEP